MQQPGVGSAAPRDEDILRLLQDAALDRAFAVLLERYEGKVYRLCSAMLRDPTQAEDVAQESWVRVWKALPTYNGRALLSSWIYAITRNRCLTAIERRRHLVSWDAAELEPEAPILETAAAESEDQSALLHELVDLLPERYRQTLTLYYYEDRSVSEVAEMLAIPEGTVKTLLYRARAALTEQLRQRGLDDPTVWLQRDP
jgi:RNA polymerase sigma-70 factor (ECF subfamily)